ncbi:MAG: hypothetical protein ACOZAN_03860 [Patescibacteria group bacterium]
MKKTSYQYHNSTGLSKILFVVGLSIYFLINTKLALAQQSSPSAKPEVTEAQEKEQEATQKLKERIEKIVEEKKEQIDSAIKEKTYQKRGFIGEIQRVTKETITIRNQKGTQIIALNNSVVFFKDKKTITIDKVAVGDWVVVLGWIEEDSFSPKRIIVYSESLRPDSFSVQLGTINNITKNSLDFITRRESETIQYTLNKKTEYQDYSGKTTSVTAFEKNTQALLIGYQDQDSKIAAVIRSLAASTKEK